MKGYSFKSLTNLVLKILGTKVNAGTGLSGGGSLEADRTLSVKYGTTAGTATQGNDSRVVNAASNATVNAKEAALEAKKADKATTIIAGTGLSGGGSLAANRTLNVSYGTAAGTAAQGNDSRLSNSREWTAATISQAETEAGTATTRRAFTAQRVRQAIVAWFNIFQTTGTSTDFPMSQKATTDQLATKASTTTQVIAGTGLTGGGTLAANRTLNVSYGTAAGTAAQGNDSRLSNSREWTAGTVSQAEAEAGTATTRRAWTAQRVWQAIDKWASGRQVISGTGLSGGGTLAANRTLSVNYGTAAGTAAQGNDSRIVNAAPNSRTITAGTGLSGGGNLTANRTISISSGVVPSTATSLGTSDLNSIQTAGYYFQSANANATTARNYPVRMAGTLVVTTAAGVVQEYTTYGPDNRKYIRGFYSTAWSAWKEVGAVPSWAAVTSKPATATRWPAFTEVTGRPANYPTTWASVADKPAQATRWPTWAEVTGKPSVVQTSGNQTIAGVKTFSSFPVTPSAAPTNLYQAANKKYVDDISVQTLVEAFSGANQGLTANGYQKLPGGLIIQWGVTPKTLGTQTVIFPVAFPYACTAVTLGFHSLTSQGSVRITEHISRSGFTVYSEAPTVALTSQSYYIAIGY